MNGELFIILSNKNLVFKTFEIISLLPRGMCMVIVK